MNEDALEGRIRDAFGHYRLDLPVAAVTQPPRPVRDWRRLLIVAVPATVLAIAVLVGLPRADVGRSVFATWSALPTLADPRLAAAASDVCLADSEAGRGASLVAQDQRGTAAAALFVGDRAPGGGRIAVTCVMAVDPSGTILAAGAATTRISGPGSGLTLDGRSVTSARGGDGLTLVYGRVPRSTAALEVRRTDGVSIEATVSGEWWLAWWPSDSGTAALVATDASGRELARLLRPDPGARGD